MEHFTNDDTGTPITQSELRSVLAQWPNDCEPAISTADVAEALHCSKEEIEALVRKVRANAAIETKRRLHAAPLRIVMIVLVCLGLALFLASFFLLRTRSGSSTMESSNLAALGLIMMGIWCAYATVCVFADAGKGRS